MSQNHVERIIGKLVTDEDFRSEFAADPLKSLETLGRLGFEFSRAEINALSGINPGACEVLAASVDPRLLKASLRMERQAKGCRS